MLVCSRLQPEIRSICGVWLQVVDKQRKLSFVGFGTERALRAVGELYLGTSFQGKFGKEEDFWEEFK
jgi:hypothetical protein